MHLNQMLIQKLSLSPESDNTNTDAALISMSAQPSQIDYALDYNINSDA